MSDPAVLRGIVHGKMIELEQDAGLPEGLPVSVVVQPLTETPSAGGGLKRSFGGWADDADDLDQYLKWSRQQRKTSRSGTGP